MREMFQLRVVAAGGLWLAAALSTEGCLFQKKPRAYVPPPVRPPAPVVLKDPPYLDPAPAVQTASVESPYFGPATLTPLPPWTPPPAPVKPRPPVAQAPKPPTPPPAEAQPTLPRITQILTAQQIRDYTREIDEKLNRVTEALNKAAGKKNLTAEQRDYVERITVFQKQAVQAREDDLVTAVSYAGRADLLATELLKRLP
jgi:hypothetical protein